MIFRCFIPTCTYICQKQEESESQKEGGCCDPPPQYCFPLINRIAYPFRILTYILILITCILLFANSNNCLTFPQYDFFGATVALSWINFIIFLSDIPFIGVYARIYITISLTFLKLSIFAGLLIIGSTLVLKMLFFKPEVPVSDKFMDNNYLVIELLTF